MSKLVWLKSATFVISAAFVMAASISFAAVAQDKQADLRLSTWLPLSHPLNPSIQAWADDIKKASKGTISMTLFTSEQLGKAFDHYDMARDGIADFTWVSPGYTPGRFPIVAAGELPFLFSNAKGGSAALDTWYRQFAAKEMKDVHFCLAFVHDPGSLFGKKKITVPGDIRGMKVRPANGTMAHFVTLLGGNNVQGSASEARDMLERGVADAITFPNGSAILFGIDKVVKYTMDVPLYAAPFVWIMNKAKYEAMSQTQKNVIDDHCTTAWAEKIATPWADFELAGMQRLRTEPGREVYKLTPEQLALWRNAAQPLQVQWADSVRKQGGNPDAIYSSLKQTIVKYKANF